MDIEPDDEAADRELRIKQLTAIKLAQANFTALASVGVKSNDKASFIADLQELLGVDEISARLLATTSLERLATGYWRERNDLELQELQDSAETSGPSE